MMEQAGERCSTTFNGARPKTTRNGTQNWPDKDNKDENSTDDIDWPYSQFNINTDESAEHNDTNDESSTKDVNEWLFGRTDEGAENNDQKDSTNGFHKLDKSSPGRECIQTDENNYKITTQQGVRPNEESLVIVTMNTNGPKKTTTVTKPGDPKKTNTIVTKPGDQRRQVLVRLIELIEPPIILCQEFGSKDIKGHLWQKYIPITNYKFCGHKEACILVHIKYVSPDDQQIDRKLREILESLQKDSKNALKKTVPMEFDPLSRIAIRKVKYGTMPEFLCASWHGWWNKKNKKDMFGYLMEFLRQVVKKLIMPLIIGGDFNIDIHDVKGMVKDPFSLATYVSSERRKGKEKDFFITSKGLRLENVQCIDFEKDAGFRDLKFKPNEILDHDPVKATITFA